MPNAKVPLTARLLLPRWPGYWLQDATSGRQSLRDALRICFILLLITTGCITALAQDSPASFPRFRFKDQDAAKPLAPEIGNLVLLTDRDFAPWSFVDEKGTAQGISVDLAVAACGAAKLACTVQPVDFEELEPALSRGTGDAIISGMRLDEAMLRDYRFTKPYYLSLGRFVARAGASLSSNDARALTGKRLGFAGNSVHELFLRRYYEKSQLQPHDTLDAALEALRTGALDAVFGDSVAISYWLAGTNSRKCCQVLGKSFVDRDSFSRELVYVTRPGRENLRDIFDAALDELEDKGETARIFTSYLPGPVW
jgi:polar amino acid transport system substrate-binding protein